MRYKERLLRILLVLAFIVNNSKISLVSAASLVSFSTFESELMNMESTYWDLTSMSIVNFSIIPASDSSGSANFVLDVSSISSAIDFGTLRLSFSAAAAIDDQPGELDLASIIIGFGTTSSAPDSTISLPRGIEAPGTSLTISSNDLIPVGTRYIFIQPNAIIEGTNNSIVFSDLSLKINDSVNPTLNYSLSPLTWTNGNVEVTLTADDTDSGVQGIYNEADSLVSSNSTYSYFATDNGSSTFTVKDYAGNISDVLTVTVSSIDRLAPQAPDLLPATIDWSNGAVAFTLSDVIAGVGEAPVTREYRLNGEEWLTYTEPASVSLEGETLIEAHSVDQAGNESPLVQSTVKVDQTAPAISLSGDAHPQPTGGITITATITDSGSGLAETRYASGSQSVDYFSTGGIVFTGSTFELLTGGTYTVFATDNVGNSAVSEIIVNSYPSLSSIDDQTINEDATIILSFSVSDGETAAGSLLVTAIADDLSLFPSLSPLNIDGTVSLNLVPALNQSGSTFVTVSVTDDGGRVTSSNFSVTVNQVNDAPQAGDDFVDTPEDELVEFTVLGNDNDVEGDSLSIIGYSDLSGGDLLLFDGDTKFRFTPPADQSGEFSFTYTITDPGGLTDSAVVTITVNNVNDAPLITNIVDQTVDEDVSTGALAFTVTDIDNLSVVVSAASDNLSLVSTSGITLGSTSEGDNSIAILPNLNQSGSAHITITADDGESTSMVTFLVTVNPVNDPPSAIDDNDIETAEDVPVVIYVLTNDTDPEVESLRVTDVGDPANGWAVISDVDQTVTYTPKPNFNGTDTFTYTVTDETGASSIATVNLIVSNVSDAPIAVDDEVSATEDTLLTIYPLANDSDPDIDLNHDWIKITSVSDPLYGSLAIAGDGSSFDYTPDHNSVATEELTYTITDSTGQTSSAAVTITITKVNDAPEAVNDSVEINEDEIIDLSVLQNDTDVDLLNGGDTLTITGVDSVLTGKVELIAGDTQLRFTPTADWNGSTSFQYAIRDVSGLTSSATVSITANPVNDAPVITSIADQTISEDQNTGVLDFSVSDVDSGSLTVTATSDNEDLVPVSSIVLNSSSGGDNAITITPVEDKNGSATVTITASDGDKNTISTFLLTVSPINDAPVVSDDLGIEVTEDVAKEISVLANDFDKELEELTVSAVGMADHGTVTISGSKKTVVYTPTANYNGPDEFAYTVSDATGATSIGNVTVNVLSINDNPVAVADSKSLNEDIVTTIDVLVNDTDVDLISNPLYETKTLFSVGDPSHGSTAIVDNKVVYTPSNNYFGSDSFTYTMQDTDGVQSSATVSLTIFPINDFPEFSNIDLSYTVNEDESITLNFNITDVETTTESLMLQVVSLDQTKVPDSRLVLGGLGDSNTSTSLTITPNANQNLDVTIKLTLGDGFVTTVQSFTLSITPVNDAPVAVADSYTFTEDNTIPLDMDNLVGNDTDIDLDVLAFVRLVEDSLGTGTLEVVNALDHTYNYIPPANFDGTTTFQYVMTDGVVEKIGTVTLRATAVNDSPILLLDPGNPSNFNEDSSAVLNFTISDNETAAKLLAVQAGSNNSDLLSPDHIAISRNDDGTGTLTLTPNADRNGSVIVTLSVSDGVILVEQPITLTVNSLPDIPMAIADSVNVPLNGSITFSPLENDYDVDGDTLTLQALDKSGLKGSVEEASSGVLTYTATGALGSDSFSYTINDGTGRTATATVSVTISGDNNPPAITGVSNQFINEDFATGDLAFSVSDPDTGSVLVVTKSSSNEELIPTSGVVVTSTGANQYQVVATPLSNKSGTTTITLTVTDEYLASTSTTFTITVFPVNDLPVAVDDVVTTPEDVSKTITVDSLLANDIDPDEGTVLQITKVTDPSHGRLDYNVATKTYNYQPDGNYFGLDSFTYTMTDGETSDTGTVTITLSPVNDTPVAYSNWVTVPAVLSESSNFDVRINDYDIETVDADLSVTNLSQPTYGTAAVQPNGTITYKRDNTNHSAGWSDSFTYTVQDDNDPPATSSVATVYIDDYYGPSLYGDDQWVGMNEDTSTDITLSIHDGYGSGYTVSFSEPSLGTITDTDPTDDLIKYTPDPDIYGSETIIYTVTSNYSGNPTSTVDLHITIYPINDAPLILPVLGDVTIDEDTSTSTLHVDISDAETNPADLIFTIAAVNSDLVLDSGIAVTRNDGSVDFVITPIANRYGSTTITLLASDGVEQTTQSFTLTVNSVNDVPVADDKLAATNEDSVLTLAVISPNADVDGDPLTLTTTVPPQHGSLVKNDDNTFTYTPVLNYYGPDTFTYQIADATSTDTGEVLLTVNPVNDPPVINNLVYDYSTLEDTPKEITFKITDVDNSLSSANVTISNTDTTLFPEGSITTSGTGEDITITMNPFANLSGSSAQTVSVNDGSLSISQDFVLSVSAVNDNPVAANDSVVTDEDTATTFSVISNDTDVEPGTLTVVSFTNPSHGSILNNRDGTLTFTPSSNFNGTDSFAYTIADINNGQSTGTVNITINPVNDAPVAVTDYATIVEDNSVTLNILTNDYDIEGSTLLLQSIGAATKGSYVNNGGGSITYTPNLDATDTDIFSYIISDGDLTSTGSIRITMTAVNDAPRLSSSVDRPWTTSEDTPGTFPITVVDPETPSDNLVIKITSSLQSLIPDTSISLTGSGQNKFVQLTPKPNQFGTLDLTFEITDGVNITTVLYAVNVLSVNDLPVISAISDKTTSEDTSTSSAGFTVSDIETAASDLTVTAATIDGVLIPAENVVVTNGTGGNRNVVVTPAGNQVGSTLVTLTVHDTDGGTADESFTVTVTAVNDPPTAVADIASVAEDDHLVINVLSNDLDPDLLDEGDNLTIVSTAGVNNGTVVVAGDNKTLTFSPAVNWNGEESFTYTMQDATGVTSTASVTVTVNTVNDPPVAVDDTASTPEDSAVVISVLTNDTDIDLSREGDDLTIAAITNVENGTAVVDDDNKLITFTPNANWNGIATFNYTITDQHAATTSAQVTVTVTPVNDPPSISDITDQILTEDTYSGEITFSVGDIDTLTENLIVTAATSNETVIPQLNINLSGSGASSIVTIMPAANKNTWNSGTSLDEPATLTITVSDGFLSRSNTFNVSVTPVNDPPVAVNDTSTTSEDTNVVINVLTNDSDVDTSNEGDSFSIVSTDNVDNGTVDIAGDARSLTFKPAANFFGTEEFNYTIQDTLGATATAKVTVSVTAVNDAPVISDVVNQTINEDSNTGALAFTISDVDSTVTCNNVTTSSNKTAIIPNAGAIIGGGMGTDCTVTATPAANKNTFGQAGVTITLNISDGGLTRSDTFVVTVNKVNDAPLAVADSSSINEDASATITPLTNDTDIDLSNEGDTLTVVSIENVDNGMATIATNKLSITFTPNPNWYGIEVFNYTVTDLAGATSSSTVTVTVIPVNDAPSISDIPNQTILEDANTGVISFSVNDIDNLLSDLSLTASTANGEIVPLSGITFGGTEDARNVTVTPSINKNTYLSGPLILTVTVKDPGNLTASDSFTMTITKVNDAPLAQDDTSSTPEDVPANILALDNDLDADLANEGETLNILLTSGVQNGVAEISGDKQTIIFTPATNWYGSETFTYIMEDSSHITSSANVTVTVSAANDAPQAVNDSDEIDEGGSSTLLVLANDTDIDLNREGDTLTIVSVADVDHGSVTIQSNLLSMTFTPDSDWNGTESFTYTMRDAADARSTATVSIKVNQINDPPTAVDDAYTPQEDQNVNLDVLANDIDVDLDYEGDNLIVLSVSGAIHGTESVAGDQKTVNYLPDAHWHGIETLSYIMEDKEHQQSTATITLTVTPQNDGPLAKPDSTITAEDTAVFITVLANDTDIDSPDGDVLTIVSVSGVEHGTVDIALDKLSLTYTPTDNWNGTEEFTYVIKDSANITAFSTVSVEVTPVKDDPVAHDDSTSTPEDQDILVNLILNDTDSDLAYGDSLQIDSISEPVHGDVEISLDESSILYRPDLNWNGLEEFTYIVKDASGATSTANVSITVTPLNDGPTAAFDAIPTDEDLALDIDVLANDQDVDAGDNLTITEVAGVDNAAVTVAVDQKSLHFAPNADWNGTETFSYSIRDTAGLTSSANVAVVVSPINDAPHAEDDETSLDEDASIIIEVLSNDTDVDMVTNSDILTIKSVSDLDKGEATITTGDLTLVFTPDPDWNGVEIFSYTMRDNAGLESSATVTVTVNPLADSSVAYADTATVIEDGIVSIPVLENDLDFDHAAADKQLTILSTSDELHGTIIIAGDQKSLSYEPDPDWNGVETFTYTIQDSSENTSSALVTVTVSPVNDAPTAMDDIETIDEDMVAELDVLANDLDVDLDVTEGDDLIITTFSGTTIGTVEIALDEKSIVYTPAADWSGVDTFTYSIKDKDNQTSSADVSITVEAVNDPPIFSTIADQTILEDESTAILAFTLSDVDGTVDDLMVTAASSKPSIVPLAGIEVGGTGANRTVKVTSAADKNTFGTTPVTITLSVGSGATYSATSFDLNVSPVNDAPMATPDAANMNEDASLTLEPLTNDTDVDLIYEGDMLTIISTSGVENASVQIINDGKGLRFIPTADWFGVEEFTYTIQDKGGLVSSAIIKVTVADVPEILPTATPTATPSAVLTFKVTAPTGGETYKDGNTVNVVWTSLAASGVVYKLEFYNGSGWSTLATGLTGNSYAHLLSNTKLHTNAAQYKVTATYSVSQTATAMSGAFIIDNIAPINIKVLLKPGNDTSYISGVLTSTSVEFSTSEGWDLTGISVRLLDGTKILATGAPGVSASVNSVGEHKLKVVATDPLGNTTVVGEYLVSIINAKSGSVVLGLPINPEETTPTLAPQSTSETINTPDPKNILLLDFPEYPEDPETMYTTILILPDGTQVELDGDNTWQATEDGTYTFVKTKANGDQEIMIIAVTGLKISSIQELKKVNGRLIPQDSGQNAQLRRNFSWELPVFGSFLLLLLVFLWPNVKIIYTYKLANGKVRRVIRYKWAVAPDDDHLKIKVKGADAYEVILSRWLTRSVRGGSLTIKSQGYSKGLSSADIPDNARNRFRANF